MVVCRQCSASSTSTAAAASRPPSARAVRGVAVSAIDWRSVILPWSLVSLERRAVLCCAVFYCPLLCLALQNMGIEASEMPALSEPSYTGEAFLALAYVTLRFVSAFFSPGRSAFLSPPHSAPLHTHLLQPHSAVHTRRSTRVANLSHTVTWTVVCCRVLLCAALPFSAVATFRRLPAVTKKTTL